MEIKKLTAAQQELVSENLYLVDKVIHFDIKRNLNNPDYSYEDLYQIGCIGLCMAAAAYDGSAPFRAYARKAVYNHIIDYCRGINRHGVVGRLNALTDTQFCEIVGPSWANVADDAAYLILLEQIREIKRRYSGVTLNEITALELKLQAENLFEIYKVCAGRKQIEGILLDYLESMEAIKISIHGRLYFVPRTHMAQVDIFEDFIEALNQHNRNQTPLTVNSMYVLDDQKQRDKMAAEFYAHIRKEIETYQERAEYFISSNCQSVAIMDRWVLKISTLEEKKRHYEELLKKELDELGEEFSTLRMFSQELQLKAHRLQTQKKCA